MLTDLTTEEWAGVPASASGVATRRRPTRHPVLDGYVEAFTVDSFLDLLADAAQRRTRLLVGNHNMHSLALLRSDLEFRRLYDLFDHVFIDGAPVVALARLRSGGIRMEHRLAVLDWIWELFARAEADGLRIVHVGGTEPMLARVRSAVLARHPDLQLTLVDGFFDPADERQNAAAVDAVRAAQPDVLLVGMGMPRQERWILQNLDALPSCPVVTVGGVLSFVGDDRPTPPRWLGPLGVEWLYRLVTEPSRLWHRYLVEPLPLVPAVGGEVARALTRPRRRTP